MEDCGKGWRLVTTAQHCDKVAWGGSPALNAAWHSSLFSDPDNQHKEKFRVDLGVDSTTKQRVCLVATLTCKQCLYSVRSCRGCPAVHITEDHVPPIPSHLRKGLGLRVPSRLRAAGAVRRVCGF